jgi:hypothetical protein
MNRGNLPGYTKAMPPLSAMPALLQPKIMFFRHDFTRSRQRRIHPRHVRNPRFKFAAVEMALGRHASGMVRGGLARRSLGGGGRPRLHQAHPIRVHPRLTPREAFPKRC